MESTQTNSVPEVNEQLITKSEDVEQQAESNDTFGTMNTVQFSINMMKSIAGIGALAIPLATCQSGIILSITLFLALAGLYILSSYQICSVQRHLEDEYGDRLLDPTLCHTDNDFARMCYLIMGKWGYYFYLFSALFVLYGAQIGTLIVMTDLLDNLPYKFLSESPKLRRFVLQSILTLIALVLCLLKDPSLLVGVSSLGLLALVISIGLLCVYGLRNYGFHFETSYLFPRSWKDMFGSFGIFVYSLGFILFLPTQMKYLKREYKKQTIPAISISVYIMAIIYCFMGVGLFLLFSKRESIPGNILEALAPEAWENMVVCILMVVVCMGMFPICMECINEMVENGLPPKTVNKYFVNSWKHVVFRIVEMVAFFIIAFAIPFFNQILSFIGNFASILIAFTIPPLLHVFCFKKTISPFMKVVDWIEFALSLVFIVICTSISFKNLVEAIKELFN